MRESASGLSKGPYEFVPSTCGLGADVADYRLVCRLDTQRYAVFDVATGRCLMG